VQITLGGVYDALISVLDISKRAALVDLLLLESARAFGSLNGLSKASRLLGKRYEKQFVEGITDFAVAFFLICHHLGSA
jgi:hypothetical protein